MRVFKIKVFHRWAAQERLTDAALTAAAEEMAKGLIDADLGGHVVKKRAALPGRGKSGGVRTLVAFKRGDKAFYMYGFAKNVRANINQKELKALRLMAAQLLGYSNAGLAKALRAGELFEIEAKSND
jgi:hypothetical protein